MIVNEVDNERGNEMEGQIQVQPKKGEGQKKKRKAHHPVLFLLSMSSGLMCAVLVVIQIFLPGVDNARTAEEETLMYIFMIALSALSAIISVVNAVHLCDGMGELCNLLWLMDNALLVMIMSLVANNGLTMVMFEELAPVEMVVPAIISISIFFYVGNFRVMVYYCAWRKCEVILCKLTLLLTACIYLGIGTYIMVTQVSHLNQYSEKYANQIKDFVFFYVFGMFSLILQLYNKVSSRDGTQSLKFTYAFQEGQDTDQPDQQDTHQHINRTLRT